MFTVTEEEFGKIVEEGIDAIPEQFLEKLDNVVIIAELEPTEEEKKNIKKRSLEIEQDWLLFGLYEGVPLGNRNSWAYTFVLPDRITIFQKSIEEVADSREDMVKIVKDTVWHEIAHFFGMNEAEVRQAEQKRNGGKHIHPKEKSLNYFRKFIGRKFKAIEKGIKND